mmetsp:Transcript_19842/g.36800  ORF Transcript_19842/g.36800 Transcript_19842/m.36800 type:complete len:626 (+) Transcript_19842:1-1878(+)
MRKLGSGSFASVFLGEHVRYAGKFVAVKAISRSKLTRRLRKNLQEEVRILQELQHENIVQLFETRESTRHVYLIMEYCAGGDLHVLLKERGALEVQEVHRLALDLAEGLHYLWSKSLIHRDLKPQNLLLTERGPKGRLKIADFGFAMHLEASAMAETMCGSPLYMAPEVLDGRSYDLHADLWSTGVILYEMIVGKPPFYGGSPRELLRNILKTTFKVPPVLAQDKLATSLLARLLTADPVRRADFSEFYNHPYLRAGASIQSGLWSNHPSCGKVLLRGEEDRSLEMRTSTGSSLPASASSDDSIFGGSAMLFRADDHHSSTHQDTKNKGSPTPTPTPPLSPLDVTSSIVVDPCAKEKQVNEDTWELVQTGMTDPGSGCSPASKEARRLGVSPLSPPHEPPFEGATSVSEQHSGAVRIVRFAGELCERAETMGNLAERLGSADPSDAVLASLDKLSAAPAFVGFVLIVKSLQVLGQALDACESITGLSDHNFVQAARITRDKLRQVYEQQLSIGARLEHGAMEQETFAPVISPEGLMWELALELGQAAASHEMLGRESSSRSLFERAELLLSFALAMLELLCADPVLASISRKDLSSFSHNRLLGTKVLFMDRVAAIRTAKASLAV